LPAVRRTRQAHAAEAVRDLHEGFEVTEPVRFVHPSQDEGVGILLAREFARLREQYGGIVRARFPHGSYPYGNSEGWVAIGYDEVKWAFSDPRFELFGHRFADYPRMLLNQADKPPRPLSFIMMDGESHARRRRVVVRHLSVKRVSELRPVIWRLAGEHLDRIVTMGSGADFEEHYADLIPVSVVCELLGVPFGERAEFVPIAVDLINGRVDSLADSDRKLLVIRNYFRKLAARRRQDPGDDFLSLLIRDAEAAGWSEEEIEGIGHTLLSAGHDAPSAILGGMLFALAHTPDLYNELRGRIDDLTGPVEEFLRYVPASTASRTRIATEDIDAFGVHIRKGEVVHPVTHGANFDSRVFGEPETIDLDRRQAPQLRFGYGPHVCPGAQLARVELEIALRAVLERFKAFRAVDNASEGAGDWRLSMYLNGPRRLRVAWELA
jgi:cytochrome P450